MKAILNFCKDYMKKVKWSLVAYILLCLLVSLSSVIVPYLSGTFIDALCATTETEFIRAYCVIIFVIGIVEILANYLSKRLYYIIQIRTSTSLNANAIYKVQNTTSQYIQGVDTAFLNQQINNDACDVIIFCIKVLHEILTNAITLIVSLALLFVAQPSLGWVIATIDVMYYLIYLLLRNPMYQRSYQTSESQFHFFSKLDEQLSNVKFLQMHGVSRRFIDRLNANVEDLLKKILKEQNVSYCFTGANSFLKTVANIVVFFIGGTAVIEKRLSIGNFSILMSYFTMSMTATHYFFDLGKNIQENLVSCDRLQKIFNLKEQTTGSVFLKEINKITCEELSFGYNKSFIFRDLNLCFKKGGIYGIVGENGAGKSTLLQVLLGVYVDEYRGQITYDGIPIEKLDMPRIREKLVGVSEQEPDLLPETLYFNLTLDDNSSLLIEEYIELCAMLNLEEFISSLPEGLDTQVDEGISNLSGGEKQKLSILRALLKRPELLVLDEPTSALDKQSRTNLREFLKSNKHSKITIISTHDKELLDICDEVITITYEKTTGNICDR